SIPQLELGTDELFVQLQSTTGPRFALQVNYDDCSFGGGGGGSSAFLGCAGGASSASYAPPFLTADAGAGPVVVQGSMGPFDTAVTHADEKQEMLAGLDQNHYFVPAGTDSAVDPYIPPGGYFLALKLRKGESTGAIQPVVVKYASDLPMIPITLTSV